MYQIDVTLAEFAERILTQINAVPSPDGKVIVLAVNDIQTRLFSQVIKPIRSVRVALTMENDLRYFTAESISPESGEDAATLEDIKAVLLEGEVLIRGTGMLFDSLSIPVYCQRNGRIYLRNTDADAVTVVYVVRPSPVMYSESEGYMGNICVPKGYFSMLIDGVLAEVYRYIGDTENCRNYTEKYNAELMDLKDRFSDMMGGDLR